MRIPDRFERFYRGFRVFWTGFSAEKGGVPSECGLTSQYFTGLQGFHRKMSCGNRTLKRSAFGGRIEGLGGHNSRSLSAALESEAPTETKRMCVKRFAGGLWWGLVLYVISCRDSAYLS